MSKHLSAQDVEQYRRQAMSPAQLLIIDAHIASCDSCRQHLDDVPRPDTAFSYLQSAFDAYNSSETHHLSFEQIVAYVDSDLDDAERESLESHLMLCQMCEAEARDLRRFSQMIDQPADQYLPEAQTTYRKKFVIFLRSATPKMAAAAAVAIMIIPIAVLISRSQVATLQSQVKELRQANEKLETDLTELRQENQRILNDNEANRAAMSDLQAQLNRYLPDAPVMKSEAVVTLTDGALQVSVDARGNLLGIESLPRQWQQEVRAALLRKSVQAPPWLSELRGKPVTLLNGSDVSVSFNLVEPMGKVVESDRPTFRWRSLEGASSYTVAVFDSRFNQVAKSDPVQATEWALPHSLPRGAIYSWQVTAFKDGKEIISPQPPASEAKFKVVEQATAMELERARRQYANSNLILGILYAQAGLLDQAERDFQALRDQNPHSLIAKNLLHSVQELQRR